MRGLSEGLMEAGGSLPRRLTDMAIGQRLQFSAISDSTELLECPHDMVAGSPRAHDLRQSRANAKHLR